MPKFHSAPALHSQPSSQKSSEPGEEQEALDKLLRTTGLNLSSFHKTTHLEVFMHSSPQLTTLQYFSALTSLKIMQQSLDRMPALAGCPALEELWVTECRLTAIEGLESCDKLQCLHLFDNRIGNIDNLHHLIGLQVLNLAGNSISSTASLAQASSLRELTLASNPIRELAFQPLALGQLSYLNLAATAVDSPKALWQLSFLPALRNLLFSDPLWGVAPFACLSNYRSNAVLQLSGLTSLDLAFISEEEREEAAALREKKRVFYSMQSKTLQRAVREATRDARAAAAVQEAVQHRLKAVLSHLDLEFETGGNIRFEPGLEGMAWYDAWACSLANAVKHAHGYVLEVVSAFKVHNKALQYRQEEALTKLPFDAGKMREFYLQGPSLDSLMQAAAMGFRPGQPVLLATLHSLVEATEFQAGQQRGAVMVVRAALGRDNSSSTVPSPRGQALVSVPVASEAGRAWRLLNSDLALPLCVLEYRLRLPTGRGTRPLSQGYRHPDPKHAVQLAFVLAPLSEPPATAVDGHPQRPHLSRRGSSKVTLQRPPGLSPQLLQASSLTCLPSIWLDPGHGRPDIALLGWQSSIASLALERMGLSDLQPLSTLTNLRHASFAGNNLSSLHDLPDWGLLLHLNLEGNVIDSMAGCPVLCRLTSLDLGCNRIQAADFSALPTTLKLLSLEGNAVTTLNGITELSWLLELYADSNRLAGLGCLLGMTSLRSLMVLDVTGNPLASEEQHLLRTVYFLPFLKVLDGASITAQVRLAADAAFCGRLLPETLALQLGHRRFELIAELELSDLRLQSVDDVFLGRSRFQCLVHLNLDGNQLTQVSSLTALTRLTHLSMSRNPLGKACCFAAPPPMDSSIIEKRGGCFGRLTALLLDECGISKLHRLQLDSLSGLETLSLRKNQLTSLGRLTGLRRLHTLLLASNAIRSVAADALSGLPCLQVLDMAENALQSLEGLVDLPALISLDASGNRLCRLADVQQLESLGALRHLELAGNILARLEGIVPALLTVQPRLQRISGRAVSENDRLAAEDSLAFRQGSQLLGPPRLLRRSGSRTFAEARETLRPAPISFEEVLPGLALRATWVGQQRMQRRPSSAHALPALSDAASGIGSDRLQQAGSAKQRGRRPSSAGATRSNPQSLAGASTSKAVALQLCPAPTPKQRRPGSAGILRSPLTVTSQRHPFLRAEHRLAMNADSASDSLAMNAESASNRLAEAGKSAPTGPGPRKGLAERRSTIRPGSAGSGRTGGTSAGVSHSSAAGTSLQLSGLQQRQQGRQGVPGAAARDSREVEKRRPGSAGSMGLLSAHGISTKSHPLLGRRGSRRLAAKPVEQSLSRAVGNEDRHSHGSSIHQEQSSQRGRGE